MIPSKQAHGTQVLMYPSAQMDCEAPDLQPRLVFLFPRAQMATIQPLLRPSQAFMEQDQMAWKHGSDSSRWISPTIPWFSLPKRGLLDDVLSLQAPQPTLYSGSLWCLCSQGP